MPKAKPVSMLCTYHPKKGKENAFLALLEKHWPALDGVGLVSKEPPRMFRAEDKRGSLCFVEMFQWKDEKSPEIAHQTPEVMAVWEPMGAVLQEMHFWQIEPLTFARAKR
jgi:quinol monooxygenase YgiN